jgi:hypothetical protein
MPSFLKLQRIFSHFPAVNSPKIVALFSRFQFFFTEVKESNIYPEKHSRTNIVKGKRFSLDGTCFVGVGNLAYNVQIKCFYQRFGK